MVILNVIIYYCWPIQVKLGLGNDPKPVFVGTFCFPVFYLRFVTNTVIIKP